MGDGPLEVDFGVHFWCPGGDFGTKYAFWPKNQPLAAPLMIQDTPVTFGDVFLPRRVQFG